VQENVRPERPDADEAPQLTDDVWELAERCWVKDPKARPGINTVCDIISSVNCSSGSPPRNVSHHSHLFSLVLDSHVVAKNNSATYMFSPTSTVVPHSSQSLS
jgi:hypothetical protein